MKYLRTAIVHIVLLGFLCLLSFGTLYIYKTNPEAQKMMQNMKHGINFAFLVRQAFITFGYLISITYSFYFAVFHFLFKKKWSYKGILYSIGVILFLILIGQQSLNHHTTFKISQIPGTLAFILFIGGIGLGARAILEYFNDKEKKKELERKNLQSELNLLRTQINPHFLFNTLNNIDALIKKDPAKASELLIKLSEEMRYMLYDSNTEKISLVSEVQFIKGYISLQKLRVKNPDFIELTIDGDFENIMIPPMLFIPFIENAFKHCNLTTDKAIVISLIANNNELVFESKNYFDPENKGNKDKVGGIGIELVRKRLNLIYPGKHILNISKTENQFIVSLTIQLDGN